MRGPRELIDAYFDGELAPGEANALQEWLLADREHMRQFVREAHFHQAARWVSSSHFAFVKAQAEEEAIRPKHRFNWRILASVFRFRLFWGGALAMCILGVAGFLWVKTRPASAMIRAETPGVYVSRGGAEWQVQGEILLRSGDRIRTEPKACAVIKYAREETRFELGGSTSLLFSQAHHGKGIWLGGGVCYGTVARQHFGQKFRFDTPQAQAEVLGTELRLAVTAATTELEVYEGVVLMRDASGKGQIRVEGGEAGFAGLEQALSKGPIPSATGHLRCQYWFEVAGGAIGDLTQDPRFPNQPDSRKQLDRCELGPETTTSFGAEISGWLHPPATGEYTFWITADDAGELWLSPNEQRETKRRICRTETYVTPEDWTKSPAQRSERIHLVAGRRYYLEALLKQAGGSAGLAVAWEGPAISREIIAGRYLSSPTE